MHEASVVDDNGGVADLASEFLGYLEAWREFRRDYGFTPRLIEHRVYNPLVARTT